MIAHEECLLEDDAGTTKGVEEAGACWEWSAEVDEDLGEFGREHTDACVSGGAGAIATSVGIDVLYADDSIPSVIKFDKFGFARVMTAEPVV